MRIFRKKVPAQSTVLSFGELFQLTDNWDFAVGLREILANECDGNGQPTNMGHVKRVLFLCMMIEDAGQADMIFNFFDEFPAYIDEVVDALFEIGAPKSAELIRDAVALLPADGVSITYAEYPREWDLISEIDAKFADYPDGRMRDLCRKYAEAHKGDFL